MRERGDGFVHSCGEKAIDGGGRANVAAKESDARRKKCGCGYALRLGSIHLEPNVGKSCSEGGDEGGVGGGGTKLEGHVVNISPRCDRRELFLHHLNDGSESSREEEGAKWTALPNSSGRL